MNTSVAKKDIRILLLEGVAQTALDQFHKAGYSNIEYHKTALARDELFERLSQAHVVGIRSRTQLDEEALQVAKNLLAVGCFCIGTNQVQLDVAQNQGVPVFNAPYSNTRSVAELVIAQAIMLMRGIPQKNAAAHRKRWLKTARGSYEVRGKTLGIIGYGHIGTQVGVLAEALGMHVIFYDVESKLAIGNAAPVGSLDSLLETADIVTLHVPLTPSTPNMIGAAELAKMKEGGILINASRGTVVDINALSEALQTEHLAGAAIDVFPVEPKSNDDPLESPLVTLDNVILTPHIGGSTQEAQTNIGLEVSSKLIKYVDNGSTLSAVNFPEVSLPEHADSLRLLHIHRNVPGVMSQINKVVSHEDVNIDGQFLRTSESLGYVVLDIDAGIEQAEMIRLKLNQIQGTVRTRIIV